jgi:hypothetical protein
MAVIQDSLRGSQGTSRHASHFSRLTGFQDSECIEEGVPRACVTPVLPPPYFLSSSPGVEQRRDGTGGKGRPAGRTRSADVSAARGANTERARTWRNAPLQPCDQGRNRRKGTAEGDGRRKCSNNAGTRAACAAGRRNPPRGERPHLPGRVQSTEGCCEVHGRTPERWECTRRPRAARAPEERWGAKEERGCEHLRPANAAKQVVTQAPPHSSTCTRMGHRPWRRRCIAARHRAELCSSSKCQVDARTYIF